jgi:hypothetical protein
LIIYIASFQVFEQPVQQVIDGTREELMQFIGHPMLIWMAESELPELGAHWVSSQSVQTINIRFVQTLEVQKLIS